MNVKAISAVNGSSQSAAAPDLRALGLNQVAYIRRYDMNGKSVWVTHAANGSAISAQESLELAVEGARRAGLVLVPLQ